MKKPIFHIISLASLVKAQLESSSFAIITITGSITSASRQEAPAVTVPSNFEGSTIATASLTSTDPGIGSVRNSTTSTSPPEPTFTQIVGGTRSSSMRSGNATEKTSTAMAPVNTQPCNNYKEFCNRRYSNITEVAAHNSPFVRARNVASNQELTVKQQLDDGIRLLQGQAHYVNNTLYYCHTSCDLLNAGTVEDYLRAVTTWLKTHPFEVLTIIFGNYNWQDRDAEGNPLVTSKNFATPIEASGLLPYVYQPPKTAMTLEDWPTLGELILSGKRVITFIDYGFDTVAVPYLLWEFYNMWETPFSPTIDDFTCEIQRPNGLSANQSRRMLYMANHNLNVEVSVAGLNMLIPNTADLAKTNGVSGPGSLGNISERCTGMWNRPPNFLLVDYYNYGSPRNGSVFEVAARANNVQYNRDCCGKPPSAAVMVEPPNAKYIALAIGVAAALIM